jgi:diguanylate cyclase (GGDEF)-like protein
MSPSVHLLAAAPSLMCGATDVDLDSVVPDSLPPLRALAAAAPVAPLRHRLVATVGQVSTPLRVVDPALPVPALDALFQQDPGLRAVAVPDPVVQASWALVTRGQLQAGLVGRFGYGHALLQRRTVADVVPSGTLVLEPDLSLPQAAARILGRSQERRYDDVLVLPSDGEAGAPRLLVVSAVFEHLADAYRALALHDALTGLPNRLLLEETGGELLGPAEAAAAVLYVDLDGFKDVNDTLGHRAGDQILSEFAQRLVTAVRTQDVVARLGGDEFAVLLPGVGEEQALRVAERALLVASAPFVVDGVPITLSASVGVAMAGEVGAERALSRLDVLLRHADGAMLRAKASGKGRVGRLRADTGESHDPSARAAVRRRLAVAIAHGGFALHYQPKGDLLTGQVGEVEALLRWRDEELGVVSPAQFIPVAESSGQIVPIGRWVLDAACAEAASWHRSGHGLVMSVNVSPVQLANPDLVDDVAAALRRHRLPAELLRLEVTETAAVVDQHGTLQQLRALRGLGVRLSLDDFGTGYSSLAMLRTLPVDAVKIDKAFIDHLDVEPADALLVGGVIRVAHALGLTVVAEGVERPEQLDRLRTLGCDAAQGYLLARPVPAEALTHAIDGAVDALG